MVTKLLLLLDVSGGSSGTLHLALHPTWSSCVSSEALQVWVGALWSLMPCLCWALHFHRARREIWHSACLALWHL